FLDSVYADFEQVFPGHLSLTPWPRHLNEDLASARNPHCAVKVLAPTLESLISGGSPPCAGSEDALLCFSCDRLGRRRTQIVPGSSPWLGPHWKKLLQGGLRCKFASLPDFFRRFF